MTEPQTPAQAQSKIFYGWWILAVVFVGEMLAIGSTSYAFGLFVKPAEEAFGISRATANAGIILVFLGMGVSAPFLGRLLDRYSARSIFIGGALVMGAGMIGVGLAPKLWMIALCLVLLVAPGAMAIGPLAANTLVARWFTRHRGKAMGMAAVATSLGGAIIVPFMAFNLDRYGWREALMIQGVVIAVAMILMTTWIIRDRPQDLGLLPDGDAAGSAAAEQSAQQSGRLWTVRQLVRTRDFWCIGLSVGTMFAINQSVLVSMVPYATDAGIGLAQATLLVSGLSIASILGKLCFGALADKVDKRWLLLTVIACTVLMLSVLILSPSFWVLFGVVCIAGFAIGGELPVWAALLGERFGAKSYGTVMGLMSPINMGFNLVAIGYIGKAFDRTGSYAVPFSHFMVLAGVATVLTVLISSRSKIAEIRAAEQQGQVAKA